LQYSTVQYSTASTLQRILSSQNNNETRLAAAASPEAITDAQDVSFRHAVVSQLVDQALQQQQQQQQQQQ
jgi:hypothetical protein